MRHKKIRKYVLPPKWHLIFYWPKQLYALCPLSDSRLMLVGVVVIIVECKLCASVPIEQQLVTGIKN